MFKFGRNSLGSRIFFSLLSLVLITFALIAVVTYFQYKEQAEDYNKERLKRKEIQIRKSIDYVLQKTTYLQTTDKIPFIFKDEIFEIARIQGENLTLYDLEGQPLISSMNRIDKLNQDPIPPETLLILETSPEERYVEQVEQAVGEVKEQLSYSFITSSNFKPLAILQIRYEDSDSFIKKELRELIIRLTVVNLLMVIIAIVLAYFLARYITRTLKTIEENIKLTQLDKRNKKIENVELPDELLTLVNAYNGMIDELEGSAAQLAQSEREAAWREMAKQVAHEIKNPLTPMRLTVQSFERKFDPEDPEINQEHYIHFAQAEEEILAKFDRTQLIRVVTNLVKNAIQATKTTENPTIAVDVNIHEDQVQITVMDNGIGITEENKPKVFEPKFTTKTSGMGLGLAMVKNILETYNGSITFTSQEGQGTVFKVTFPREIT